MTRYAAFVITMAGGVVVMGIGHHLNHNLTQVAGFLVALSGFVPLWIRGIYVWLHGVSGRGAARFGASLAALCVISIGSGTLLHERGFRGAGSALTVCALASLIALGVTCVILFALYFLRILFGAMTFFRR